MEKLTLYKSSVLAEDECLVYSSIHAKLYMGAEEVYLVCLKDRDGDSHFCWSDDPYKPQILCVVFPGDDAKELSKLSVNKKIEVDEVFCHKGATYYLNKESSGQLTIRQVRILSSQKMVEQAIAYEEDPDPLESIYLSGFYRVGRGKDYLATGWVVWRKNEEVMTFEYIPLFEDDEELFISNFDEDCWEDDNVSVIREDMPEGSEFAKGDYIYRVEKDENDKLYLSRRHKSSENRDVGAMQKFLIPKKREKGEYLRQMAKIVSLH